MAGNFKQVETAKDQARLVTSGGTRTVALPSAAAQLRYAYVSQRGFYPDQPDKANQDMVCATERVAGNPDIHLFVVFDGHGECGTECAQFAQEKVRWGSGGEWGAQALREGAWVQAQHPRAPQPGRQQGPPGHLGVPTRICPSQLPVGQVPANLAKDKTLALAPETALRSAMVSTNAQLHRASVDDTLSGSTACAVLLRGPTVYVANVGDSRAVLAEQQPGGRVVAKDL